MVDSGYNTPAGRVVVRGKAPRVIGKNVGVATSMYPGRLVVREATDYDVKVADGVLPPVGWLGFEDANGIAKPASPASIYTIDTEAPVLSGGGFAILAKLAKGFVALEGDDVFSWGDGKVAVGAMINGVPAIRVPFVQGGPTDTNVDVPGGVVIPDTFIKVATEISSGTIDVGFINAVEGGDADGLLDGELASVAGWVPHNLADATAASITLGALLKESNLKDAWVPAIYYAVPKKGGYLTDGTIKSLAYTTSAHAIVGDIYVLVNSPGVRRVGKCGRSVSAASADADMIVEAGDF
jgi:hypothetical protein